jgi:hypothetical protein
MHIGLQTAGLQLPPRPADEPTQQATERGDQTNRAGELLSPKESSATVVSLSTAPPEPKPVRNPKYNIIWNYDEELQKNPTEAITKLRTAFIELDKAFLAKLDSDDKPIDLRTGNPVSDPKHIAILRESTLRRLAENEAVLNEHLTVAAGGNPAGDRAKAEAAALADPNETSVVVEPARGALTPSVVKSAAGKKTATPLDNAAASAALLIELLAKGNDAYRAAAKRVG